MTIGVAHAAPGGVGHAGGAIASLRPVRGSLGARNAK